MISCTARRAAVSCTRFVCLCGCHPCPSPSRSRAAPLICCRRLSTMLHFSVCARLRWIVHLQCCYWYPPSLALPCLGWAGLVVSEARLHFWITALPSFVCSACQMYSMLCVCVCMCMCVCVCCMHACIPWVVCVRCEMLACVGCVAACIARPRFLCRSYYC